MTTHLVRRDGWWYFNRKTPLDLRDIDPVLIHQTALRIRVADDPRGVRAGRLALQHSQALDDYWRDLVHGRANKARQRLNDAMRRARLLGFQYTPRDDLLKASTLELVRRVEALERGEAKLDTSTEEGGEAFKVEREAMLGDAPPAAIKVSTLFDEYDAFMSVANRKKSPNQKRKWDNQKKSTIAAFIKVVGDKDITEITREDANLFREWWAKRLLDGMDNSSANRDIGNMSTMLKKVAAKHQIKLGPLFAELRFPRGGRSRPPFPIEFLRDKFLEPEAFADLNAEARRAVFVMVETGMRPSEIVNLTKKSIVLDAAVPHVVIEEVNREVKTETSKRMIPLVGVALAAMKKQPNGFPRYHDKEDAFSAVVNKHLEAHKLLPTDRHVLYCVRHTFKDRLRKVVQSDEMIDALMGHRNPKPKYGEITLEQKQEWLQKIAFTAFPSIV